MLLTAGSLPCSVPHVTLSEFLLKLAADPHLLEQFRRDPQAIADKYELEPEQLRLLGAGKLEEIRFEIRAELGADDERVSVIWIHSLPGVPWLFKGPDPAP